MGFARKNAGKEQFWLASKQSPIYLASNANFITISFDGKPMPLKPQDLVLQLFGYTGGTVGPYMFMGSGCFSANLGYISVYFSNTSASLTATATFIAEVNWLIGSR